MQKILEIENLTKKYKNGRGIENINLVVNRGDIVGLLGPNGSGKTTIMKAIAGLIHPDGGSIKIFGRDTESEPAAALSDVGFLIESPALYPFMTAYGNLKTAAAYYPNVGDAEIQKALELVGLALYRDDKVSKFSLGMKQRLGLALAVLSMPRLMVLDEPLNGLDIEGVIRIRELIEQMSKQNGAACLISGHVAAELEKVCSHVAVLHEGKIAAFETLENALKYRPSLEEYYISVVRGCGGGVSL